jgi:hypothetical protein
MSGLNVATLFKKWENGNRVVDWVGAYCRLYDPGDHLVY